MSSTAGSSRTLSASLLPAWKTHPSLPSDEEEIKAHKREWERNQERAGDESPAEQAAIMTDDDVRQRGTLGQRMPTTYEDETWWISDSTHSNYYNPAMCIR